MLKADLCKADMQSQTMDSPSHRTEEPALKLTLYGGRLKEVGKEYVKLPHTVVDQPKVLSKIPSAFCKLLYPDEPHQKTHNHLKITLKSDKRGRWVNVGSQRSGWKRLLAVTAENESPLKRRKTQRTQKAAENLTKVNKDLQVWTTETLRSVSAGTQKTHRRLVVTLKHTEGGWQVKDTSLSQKKGAETRQPRQECRGGDQPWSQRQRQKQARDLKNENEPQNKRQRGQSDPANLYKLYHIGELMGNGGFGAVYAGIRKADGLPVAIKYVSKQKPCQELQIPGHGFLPTEVALMTSASTKSSCSNIVQLLEWYNEPTHYIMVLERPEPCEDLREFCRNFGGSLTESVARNVMLQLIQALKHCQTCGILHRDVKPENILIQPDTLMVKLFDFGCGDLIRDSYRKFRGTLLYAPPEVHKQKRYQAEPVTVWSVGVVLYQIVCGSLPFMFHREIIYGPLRIPRSLSTDCTHLIRWCLSLNASCRPSLEQIECHRWFHPVCADGQETTTLKYSKTANGCRKQLLEQIGQQLGLSPSREPAVPSL